MIAKMSRSTRVALVVSLLFSFPYTSASLHLREPLGLTSTDKEALETYTPEANKDRILDLPGLDYDPGFNQFSGYLTVSQRNGRKIFYWFVESQKDPAHDPVVFWTNGGPGCSGLLGFGTEHGPFFVGKNGSLSENPYSWNKAASILYVEQPAGVGFSYSNTHADYTTGDAKAASDNYLLIREFLKRFPEKQANDFYISSESYGGHYMPQLTLEILKRNKDCFINFRGFMVGNPYVDPFTNTLTQIDAYYAHGLLAKPLYDKWDKLCSKKSNYESAVCDDLQESMFEEFGDGINPYALDFPVCTEDDDDTDASTASHPVKAVSSQALHLLHRMKGSPPFLPDQDKYHPCGEEHIETYLNRWDVQIALHAHVGTKWEMCSTSLNYSDKDSDTPQMNHYKDLVKMGVNGTHALNMLVFSGDDDSICSTAGTQAWIYNLGVKPMEGHLWKAWKVEEQTAGFVTHFDLGKKAEATFTFATVHGAGHEVPAYRPMEALQLFKTYLRGEWL